VRSRLTCVSLQVRQGSADRFVSNAIDGRWDRLRNQSWTCATCGGQHPGLFDLGALSPEHWQDPSGPQPNSTVIGSSHCLTEDFCIIGGRDFFVRCILELPLAGAAHGARFSFGVWTMLAEPDFRTYLDAFDEGVPGDLGPWPGGFSNRLAAYPDTLNLKCHVHTRARRQRPWIEFEPSSTHPLARESRKGIPYERLLEIYAAYGHAPAPDAAA
jgi:hypothetical protein